MSDPVVPGRVLGGRYQLESILARGGMAAVWIADDAVLSRRVAVKVLHPELAEDESVRARFRREALAAARVTHPNIVAVYDTGEDDDGVVYIVMELVDGTNLRDLLGARGPLDPDEAVAIASQIADALDVAHASHLVHRDVKPANVLLSGPDHVKVTDFGIAKAIGAGGDLTRTGTIVGTARYLAPEQVTGGDTDARTDVYALALLVYEMLAGAPPFGGDTDIGAAMARLTADPPPLRSRRPDVPLPLADAVHRGLARDPDQRWPSAAAFRTALRGDTPPPRGTASTAALESDALEASVVPSRGRRRVGALLAAAGVAVAAAVIGAVVLADGNGTSGGTGQPITVVGTDDFDPPPGDGQEGASSVGGAVDGNPETGWTTETYATPDFGRAKGGVGLSLDLGTAWLVRAVTVDTDLAGWSAEVYVADDPGATLDSWGPPRASLSDLGTSARFELEEGSAGRFVLLWLTLLPDGGRLSVREVRVEG